MQNRKFPSTQDLKGDLYSFRRYGILIAALSFVLPLLAFATPNIEGQWNALFVVPAVLLIAVDGRLAELFGWRWNLEGEGTHLLIFSFMAILNTLIAFVAYVAMVSMVSRKYRNTDEK